MSDGIGTVRVTDGRDIRYRVTVTPDVGHDNTDSMPPTVTITLSIDPSMLTVHRTGIVLPAAALANGQFSQIGASLPEVPELVAECRAALAALTVDLARRPVATSTHVAVALSHQDVADLRTALRATADGWREVIAQAKAGAAAPPRDKTTELESGTLNIEPSPRGYHTIAALFTEQLDRLTRLADRIDQVRQLTQESP